MKKFVVVVCALVITAACAVPPTNQPTTTSTNRSAEPAAAGPLTEADALTKEKAVWDALKRKDYDAFGTMMASDYLEVLPDGVNNKAETLTEVKDLEISDVTLADSRLIPIDNTAALLNYNATIKGKFKGQAFPEGPYRVTSGWVNRDGKWQIIYYQESLVKPEPSTTSSPATSPAVSPAASAASPAAGATPATLPNDPVEREKVIWDALKRRDYDAFASHLDPAQVEVGPAGVNDKAGTLKGVRSFDASKSQLSDFKIVKLNANAELVNYLVTSTGPTPEKHLATTVWVNRDGKWVALFHQGTDMAAPSASPSPSTTATAK